MFRVLALLAGLGLGVVADGVYAASVVHDCPDCPEMVVLPAGSFMMGEGEKDTHKVTFPKPFALATTPVTQGQWQAIMGKNPSEFVNCGSKCPVENVSWDDVQIFILRLNAKTGKHYRLPSEAEWEYGCKAAALATYCGGNDLDQVAWYEENSGNSTHPVATRKANAWGLYDMSGNVWEWVEDCYHDTLQGAPTNGAAWTQNPYPQFTQTCLSRVVRGGSWQNPATDLIVVRRSADDPSVRVHSIGFRLARSL
jgi:formylglycine-generating enzyme required for sulfatase activity